MFKLVIGNSQSQVSGFSRKEYSDLRYLLSYKISESKRIFSGGFGPTVKYLIDRKGTFNTGLLPLVIEYLEQTGVKYQTVDSRHPPKRTRIDYKLNLNGLTPYASQLEIVAACRQFKRGTISAVTGSGKSLTTALLVKALGCRTLIVVPNLGLKQQLTASFKTWFGTLDNITIENIDSKVLKEKGDYDLLIVDEAHHVAAETYQKLNKTVWGDIYYRFFFTATPFRSDPDEQMLLESIAGQVIYTLDYHKASQYGIICPINAYYIEAPKVQITGRGWQQVYNQLVVNNKARNNLITRLLIKFQLHNVPTLCLCKEIEHGKILGNGDAFRFTCGEDKESKANIDMFNCGIIKTLIGTNGVLGEGIDSRPAEIVIIAGMGKSKPAFVQQVGRVLRRSPGKEIGTVVLIKDSSHKFGKSHFAQQCQYLKEIYNVTPIKLEI